ncbi:MAG: HtrA protease/chaperone [Planctomycetota bacterium]|nr:MAG: HtrA protease/chaperone [Planctomycetota bacterium]
MKAVIPAALVAFVLGAVAGLLFERRRHETAQAPAPAQGPSNASSAPAPDSGKRVADAEKQASDAKAELVAAKEKIAKLEAGAKAAKSGGKKELTPEEAKARMEELRAQIPDLVAKKDGNGLIKLMNELAELGEVGYMAAIEISGLISADVEGGKNEFGLSRNEFYMAFSGPMLPVMVWGLQKGEEIPAGFRIGAAYALPWHPELEPGKLFLESLKNEKNADVARALADNLDGIAKAGMEADLAALVPGYADNARVVTSLLDSLVKIGSPEALASLEGYARSDNEFLRAEAAVALIAINPPAEGVLITLTVPNSQAENVGIKRGDIITSYNGTTVTDFAALRDQMKSAPAGSVVTVTVNRNGEIIPIQIKAGAKIGIDGKDVKPK